MSRFPLPPNSSLVEEQAPLPPGSSLVEDQPLPRGSSLVEPSSAYAEHNLADVTEHDPLEGLLRSPAGGVTNLNRATKGDTFVGGEQSTLRPSSPRRKPLAELLPGVDHNTPSSKYRTKYEIGEARRLAEDINASPEKLVKFRSENGLPPPSKVGGIANSSTRSSNVTVDELFSLREQGKVGFGLPKAAPPPGPAEPRGFVGETATAAVRGTLDIVENLGITARGLLGGAESTANGPRTLPFGPQPSRDPGSTSNLVGGLVPMLAAGPVGGSLAFASSSYASTLQRTEGNVAAAATAGVVSAGLGLIPFAKVATPVTNKSIRLAVEAMASGLGNVGVGRATEAIAVEGGATPQEGDALEEFAVGALAHLVVAPVRHFASVKEKKVFDTTVRELLKVKLVRPEEIALIGDRPEIIDGVIKARAANKIVELKPVLDKDGKVVLTPDGLAKLVYKVTDDPVSQAEKKGLLFNDAAIDAYREDLRKGGNRIFLEPSRLPVTEQEAVKSVQGLNDLANELAKLIDPAEFGPGGEPLTERAGLLHDAGKLAPALVGAGTGSGSRTLVELSNALVLKAAKLKSSDKPLAPEASQAARGSTGLVSLTPEDLRPHQAPWLPLPQTTKAGYMRPATELSQHPATQRRIEARQRKTIERLGVLQDTARFPIADKVRQSQYLDAAHVEAISILLAKDNDNATGAKRRVVKAITKSTIPVEQQPAVIDSLSKAIDLVSEKFPEESLKGTLARLLEESADPKYGLSPEATVFLTRHVADVLTKQELPLSVRMKEDQAKLKEYLENFAGYGLEDARAKVVDLAHNLEDHVATPYLKAALDPKATRVELEQLARDVGKAQESYLHRVSVKDIVRMAEGTSKNPQRDSILRVVGGVKPRAAEVAPSPPKPAQANVGPRKGHSKPARATFGKAEVEPIISRYLQTGNLVEPRGLGPAEQRLFYATVHNGTLLRISEYTGQRAEGGTLEEVIKTAKRSDKVRKESPGGVYDALSEKEIKEFDSLTTLLALSKEKLKSLDKQTQTTSSAALRPTVRYEGKDYVSDISHADAMRLILEEVAGISTKEAQAYLAGDVKLTPENKEIFKIAQKLLLTPEVDNIFLDSAGKVYSRAEATAYSNKNLGTNIRAGEGTLTSEDLARPAEVAKVTKTVKPPSPSIVTDPKTGKVVVDAKALQRTLETLTLDEVTALHNEIKSLVRKGVVEQGLYKKALKFDPKLDAREGVRALSALPKRGKTAQALDTGLDVTKLVVDPKTVDALLEQLARGDKTNPLYHIFHEQFREPFNRHLQNRAEARRFSARTAREVLGLETASVRGQARLARYLTTVLPSGVTRDRAMRLYAWSKDVGRASDLADIGAVVDGKAIDVEAALRELSSKDRVFVDRMKEYFQNNPMVEKAFNNVLLLQGYEPQRIRGWYPSARTPEKVRLESNFDTLTATLMRDIDPLKERQEGVSTPFDVDQGFYSAFLGVTDRLSTFAEMGRELYRAQKLLINGDFESSFKDRLGKAAYQTIQMYLSNIGGQLGHQNTALDATINRLQSGYTIAKVGLSPWSAAKQGLHVLTMLADNTLSSGAILQALAEGSAVSRRVGQTMQDNSGLAYQRYTGGDYLQHLLVQADENKLPSRLSVARHYAMVAQRMVDRSVMQVAWRAAEITAQQRGLKGLEAREETQRLFNISAGRDQPTDNPLYASQLELEAKRQPLIRGSLMFQREQNRIYNVMRRHVVRAIQQPTADNVTQAGKSLMFGLAGNVLGVLAINELRRLAFDRETTPEIIAAEAFSNVAGMYYLAAAVETTVQGIIDIKKQNTDRLAAPIMSTVIDLLVKTPWAIYNAIEADDKEVASGIARGESRSRRHLLRGLDSSLSGASTLLGLPLWAVFAQGRGLYVWTDPALRSMTHFEVERQMLKQAGDEKSSRWRELSGVHEKILELHRLREKGLLTKDAASDRIVRELQKVGF